MFLTRGAIPSRFALAHASSTSSIVRTFAVSTTIIGADWDLAELALPLRISFAIQIANALVVFLVACTVLITIVKFDAVH